MVNKNQDIRILLAEDDFLVGKEIERTLKLKGYDVVGLATTGTQAIEKVKTLKPDLVLMDIKMPEMDGLEATENIQKLCPTPVVILTAHETPDFLEKASRVGAGAYLVKPPRPEELERGICIAMARHQDLINLRELLQTLEEKNKALEKALKEIKTLQGIIPICAKCKKIRDDKGYWHQVDQYIAEHTEAQFSHGMCRKCSDDLYGGQDWYEEAVQNGEIPSS
ncbi:MAG: response regulator [Desulfobulbaceae bacterium]|uniref:Response regulator n=1 Tax=Candidatus Desulfobia pelagia TaxID=2841692 RepID=A0A8J6TDI3_9BACT|nr:response regulator [Candidatus Desulfobia pelagia]